MNTIDGKTFDQWKARAHVLGYLAQVAQNSVESRGVVGGGEAQEIANDLRMEKHRAEVYASTLHRQYLDTPSPARPEGGAA